MGFMIWQTLRILSETLRNRLPRTCARVFTTKMPSPLHRAGRLVRVDSTLIMGQLFVWVRASLPD